MIRDRILLVLAALVVAWGCGQQQQPPTLSISAADKNKLAALEATVAKLEKELKQVQTVRDATQTLLDQQVARGQALERERDGLAAALKSKGAEKDALQGQYDGFRKSLRDLLAQADAAAAPTAAPAPTDSPVGAVIAPPKAGF